MANRTDPDQTVRDVIWVYACLYRPIFSKAYGFQKIRYIHQQAYINVKPLNLMETKLIVDIDI